MQPDRTPIRAVPSASSCGSGSYCPAVRVRFPLRFLPAAAHGGTAGKTEKQRKNGRRNRTEIDNRFIRLYPESTPDERARRSMFSYYRGFFYRQAMDD